MAPLYHKDNLKFNIKEKKEVFQKLGIDSKKVHFKLIENIIERFPTFRYKLKQGLFWNYFKYK